MMTLRKGRQQYCWPFKGSYTYETLRFRIGLEEQYHEVKYQILLSMANANDSLIRLRDRVMALLIDGRKKRRDLTFAANVSQELFPDIRYPHNLV